MTVTASAASWDWRFGASTTGQTTDEALVEWTSAVLVDDGYSRASPFMQAMMEEMNVEAIRMRLDTVGCDRCPIHTKHRPVEKAAPAATCVFRIKSAWVFDANSPPLPI